MLAKKKGSFVTFLHFLCPKLSQMAALLQCDVISFKGAEHVVLFIFSAAMLLALFH